jgi:hypothetical protein
MHCEGDLMKQMGSREFQLSYQKLTEPTEVVIKGVKKGTWYPAGAEPVTVSKIPDSRLTDWNTPWEPAFRPVPKKK